VLALTVWSHQASQRGSEGDFQKQGSLGRHVEATAALEMGDEKWLQFFAPIFLSATFFWPQRFCSLMSPAQSLVWSGISPTVVKGARITVTNTQTNLSQQTVSAEDGSYHFLACLSEPTH